MSIIEKIKNLFKKKEKKTSAIAKARDYYLYYIGCSGNHIPGPHKLAIVDLINEGNYTHNEILEAKRELYKFDGDFVGVEFAKRNRLTYPTVIGVHCACQQ